jgi:hypothetical protein
VKVRIRTNPAYVEVFTSVQKVDIAEAKTLLEKYEWRLDDDVRKHIRTALIGMVIRTTPTDCRYLVETKRWWGGWKVYVKCATYQKALDFKIELETGQVIVDDSV